MVYELMKLCSSIKLTSANFRVRVFRVFWSGYPKEGFLSILQFDNMLLKLTAFKAGKVIVKTTNGE